MDKYDYSYDANGNITSVVTKNGTISYQYDELNQLTQETLLDGTTITYEHDAVGNRTKKTSVKGSTTTTTNYTYNDGNELTTVNGQTYTYDQNGNLTNNGAKTFIYDVENRLKEVKNSSGQTLASFTYDHGGKRNSMTTSTGTVFFHYSGDKVTYETNSSNAIIAEYTYDAQGNPATMTKNGVMYYYHVNGHGDVISMTDSSGTTVTQYTYDAYGNMLSQSGTMASANPLRYAGYRYDEATGLYYLMARYYDSNIGRFITRDTFHGFEDEPASLNQYNYAHSNPVKYVDPDGYAVAQVIGGIIGGGLGSILGKAVADHYKLTGAKRTAAIAAFGVGGLLVGTFALPVVLKLIQKVLLSNKILQFSATAASRMADASRYVPLQILKEALKGKSYKDPQGSAAKMFYTQMWKNGKLYNLEVLYDKASNRVLHFVYTQKSLGPLGPIK